MRMGMVGFPTPNVACLRSVTALSCAFSSTQTSSSATRFGHGPKARFVRLGRWRKIFDGDSCHLHHCLERVLAVVTVEALQRAGERCRYDLPTDAPTVLAPAAHAFAPTVRYQSIPDAIDIFLGAAGDLKAHRLGVREPGASVEAGKGSAEQFELHGEDRTFGALCIGLVVADLTEARTGKEIDIERRRFEGFGIEPQKCCEVGDGHAPSVGRCAQGPCGLMKAAG